MSVISGFHHVALTVRDLATSAEWYRTVLGLEELFRRRTGRERLKMGRPVSSPA
jgi:catechol 2,3-dioxygenase-like lactoylglutathione lyase family enzyme